MKNLAILPLLASIVLLAAAISGCGQTQSSLSPKEKADFGKRGEPMPAAAQQYMQQHQTQAAPGAASQKK